MKIFILLIVVKVFNPDTHKLITDHYLLNFDDAEKCKTAALAVRSSTNVEKAYCTEFPEFKAVE